VSVGTGDSLIQEYRREILHL